MVLSIFIVAIGACWITADRQANNLVIRQKAIFAASAEMERLTALYGNTSFGAAGPLTTSAYDGPAVLPATRLTYPTSLSGYIGGSNYITTSAATFQSGSPFQVWETNQLAPTANRSFVWLDPTQNVMARLSWKTTAITPASCVVGNDGCGCLNFQGSLTGLCQRLDLYLEYPYRLVSGNAVAGATLQTVTLSTIVGRHT